MMGFSSRSSNGHQFRNGNNGSNHYQKKGILGNLFNQFVSRSGSGGHYNPQGNQFNNQPGKQFNNPPLESRLPANQGGINCGKCSSPIPAGAKFCLQCGDPVKTALFCPNCGEKLPAEAKFCLNCGNKLNG